MGVADENAPVVEENTTVLEEKIPLSAAITGVPERQTPPASPHTHSFRTDRQTPSPDA